MGLDLQKMFGVGVSMAKNGQINDANVIISRF